MKTIIAAVIIIIAVPVVIFFIRNAIERSKSNKTSLFGSFNGEYVDDNLGKVTPSALKGLDEAEKARKEREG